MVNTSVKTNILNIQRTIDEVFNEEETDQHIADYILPYIIDENVKVQSITDAKKFKLINNECLPLMPGLSIGVIDDLELLNHITDIKYCMTTFVLEKLLIGKTIFLTSSDCGILAFCPLTEKHFKNHFWSKGGLKSQNSTIGTSQRYCLPHK